MKKYHFHTNKKLAVIQWNEVFEYADMADALEEVSERLTNPVPLLLIDHSTEFNPSSNELETIVSLFEKYQLHFKRRVALVVSKDVHYGLGHMAHVFFSLIGIDFLPFWNMGAAREWLSEIQP